MKTVSTKVSTKQIETKYVKKMKRSFKKQIEIYIDTAEVQKIIKKALKYKLTKADYTWLYANGNHSSNSKYPHLNWLCAIYIHELTIGEGVYKKCLKVLK
jgi:hypothetical protein